MIRFDQFVLDRLPEPPARVLEVGCGAGELTTALSIAGHDVLGIDPAAPHGANFRRLTLDGLDEPGAFDAVVGAQALHRASDLDAALDRIVELLRPGGLLLLDELAWEALDEPTLDWLHGQRRALAAAGQGETPESLEALRADWEAEHLGQQSGAAMLEALDVRFEQLEHERTPYLHRLLGGVATEVLEEALVAAGAIAPLGFRYVGRPRSPQG